VVRARARRLRIKDEPSRRATFTFHLPKAPRPKDGSERGVCDHHFGPVSTLSAPVRPNVAMTGEITLSCEILAIGRLEES